MPGSPDTQARFESILVVATRQLGDVLLTTPLIAAARARWPQARIDVLGFAGTLGLLEGHPGVDHFIEVPAGSGWRRSWPLIRKLWRRYDLALVSQFSDRAHLYGLIAARVRSGLVTKDRAQSWWKRLTLRHYVVVDEAPSHVVIEKLRLLEPWTLPAPVHVRAPEGRPLPQDLANSLQPPYAVVQVPSLVRYKQWPLGHVSRLVASLVEDGLQVVLTGSSSPADRAKVDEVLEHAGASGRVLDAAGRLDLRQVATLLRGAAVYVGPDTSITHLAAAYGTPTVALFGPISPMLWGPWPQGHMPVQPYVAVAPERQQHGTLTLLQGFQSCVPCNRAGCDNHVDSRSECLETMPPERVLQEVRRLLGPSPREHGLPMPLEEDKEQS